MKIKYQPSQTEIKIKKKVYVNKLEHIVTTLQADQLVDQGDAIYVPHGETPDRNLKYLLIPNVSAFERKDNPVQAYYKDLGKNIIYVTLMHDYIDKSENGKK